MRKLNLKKLILIFVLILLGMWLTGLLLSCTAVDGLDSTVYGESIIPQTNNLYVLGTPSLKFADVELSEINGVPYTTITFTGNYTLGLTLSNNTALTLPTSGTLSTLAGTETLTNKTITTPTVNIVLTAGETIAAGAGCYVKSDGKVYNAKADSSTTMPCTLLCTVGATVGNACTLVCFGYVTTGSWTAGGYIYVSDSVAGGLTQTLPTTSGDQVQVVGIAITSTQIYWNPSLTIVGRS